VKAKLNKAEKEKNLFGFVFLSKTLYFFVFWYYNIGKTALPNEKLLYKTDQETSA